MPTWLEGGGGIQGGNVHSNERWLQYPTLQNEVEAYRDVITSLMTVYLKELSFR